MLLKLIRSPSNDACTIGKLYVDGAYQCFTLEDVVRTSKIAGRTAIPAGRYKVRLTMSPRFKRILPLLENVPNYSGVRIHPGNTADDTEGCILPGETNPSAYSVGDSGKAFKALMVRFHEAEQRNEEIWIEIE